MTEPIPSEPESTAPLFSQVYSEFLQHKINKDKLSEKMQKSYERLHTALHKELIEAGFIEYVKWSSKKL